MTRLVGAAVNITLQKFEIKLQQFNEMEEIIEAERRELAAGALRWAHDNSTRRRAESFLERAL